MQPRVHGTVAIVGVHIRGHHHKLHIGHSMNGIGHFVIIRCIKAHCVQLPDSFFVFQQAHALSAVEQVDHGTVGIQLGLQNTALLS